jgi:hypothetical protein
VCRCPSARWKSCNTSSASMPILHPFPGGNAGAPLSQMATLQSLRGMRPSLSVHGFRARALVAPETLITEPGGGRARAWARGDFSRIREVPRSAR